MSNYIIDDPKKVEAAKLLNEFQKPTEPLKRETAMWKLPQESMFFDKFLQELDGNNALSTETIESLLAERTRIPEFVDTLLYFLNEADALSSALGSQLESLKARKLRIDERKENIRETLLNVFRKFSIKKLECPSGTISLTERKASKLMVTNEADIMV